MKKLLLTTTLVAAFTLSSYAAESKLTGEATCAKCDLKKVDSCQLAIKTKSADGKEEILLAEQNKVAKDFHPNICQKTEKVKAEGTVTEKDGQKVIALTKVEIAK